MDMGTIGAIAVLLLAVSSAALAAQNRKGKDDDSKEG
mgnify:FL=1